jgi:hypothetical protein
MEILALSAISLLAIRFFQPIQPYREKLVGWLINFMIKRNWWWMEYPIQIISCAYCFSFWMSLAITLSLAKASIVAILTLLTLHVIEALRKYLSNGEE